MPTFQFRRSQAILVLRDFFKFLCVLSALLSLYLVPAQKTVHPSLRTKICDFQPKSTNVYQTILNLKLMQQDPYKSNPSVKLFLIPQNFYYRVISKNPDFFFEFLTIFSMSTKLSATNASPKGQILQDLLRKLDPLAILLSRWITIIFFLNFQHCLNRHHLIDGFHFQLLHLKPTTSPVLL